MPKNQRRANTSAGAERHGVDVVGGQQPKGQGGYTTSVNHRESRRQDGKDHHGGGERRSGDRRPLERR